MADVLSVASIFIGLVEVSSSVVRNFRDLQGSRQLAGELKRFEATTQLLKRIGDALPKNDVVPGTELCLGLCSDALLETQSLVDEFLYKKNKTLGKVLLSSLKEKLQERVQKFSSAVELLRGFAHELRSTPSLATGTFRADNKCNVGIK